MVYCIIDTVVSKTWTTIFMKCNSTDILHFAKKQKNLFTERYSEILSNKLLTWCKWSSIFHFLKTTLIQYVKYLICHFNVVSFYSCNHQHNILYTGCCCLYKNTSNRKQNTDVFLFRFLFVPYYWHFITTQVVTKPCMLNNRCQGDIFGHSEDKSGKIITCKRVTI